MILNHEDILEILPHRYPMLLVDRIVELEPMKRFRPRAKGSASPINKRTAHITVAVAEK